jgi:hypothetical protein
VLDWGVLDTVIFLREVRQEEGLTAEMKEDGKG